MRGSRNFRQGGGVQVSLTNKALTTFFFSPLLILQKSNSQFQRKLSFFKVPEGVQLFPGGGGGSNCLFPIQTHITCDFPEGGGVRTPCLPLWIRTWNAPVIHYRSRICPCRIRVENAWKAHVIRISFPREFRKANQSSLSILQCNAVTSLPINKSSIATQFNVQYLTANQKGSSALPDLLRVLMIILLLKPRKQQNHYPTK